jgi:prephenate dehydrogenase
MTDDRSAHRTEPPEDVGSGRAEVAGTGRAEGAGSGRAEVVGTGLIGASVGLALRERGWHVTGRDRDPAVADAALRVGALDVVGVDEQADVVVVATPLGSTVEVVGQVLAEPRRPDVVVTDVAAVKAPVADVVHHPRFVGGHPMAGSEQVGVAGADGRLFVGATWVLTPTLHTAADAFAAVRAVVTSLGAEVVALDPEQHDELVAVVSHVPHLTAASLMHLAAAGAKEHAVLLHLAAGGFRDMTRVAAGEPHIWPDVCAANRAAIVSVLDGLIASLGRTRQMVADGDRAALLTWLQGAADARRALPVGGRVPTELAELRVPVPDRPGVLADILIRAGELAVNVLDVEIAHSAEGDRGVLVLVVDAADVTRLTAALGARGFVSSERRLS